MHTHSKHTFYTQHAFAYCLRSPAPLIHTHTYTHTHKPTHDTHTHTHCLTVTDTHTHTCTCTHTFSLTPHPRARAHTHTHTFTQVENGAWVNAPDFWGNEPLRYAVKGGHVTCAEVFVIIFVLFYSYFICGK
jgi:hypothetical protein